MPDSLDFEGLYNEALSVTRELQGRRVGEPYLLNCGLHVVDIDNFRCADSIVIEEAYGSEYADQLKSAEFTAKLRRQGEVRIRRDRARQRAVGHRQRRPTAETDRTSRS